VLAKLQTADVDLDAVTAVLEREGASFCDSSTSCSDCITEKAAGLGVRLDPPPGVPERPET
jgi:hypothetical protein